MKNFTMIPNEIFQDTRLSAFQFKLLVGLYSYRNVKTALAYPKRETLAQLIGCDPRSVSRTTKELGELGWLTKIGDGGRSRAARYQMHIPSALGDECHDQPNTVLESPDQSDTHHETPDSVDTLFLTKGNQPDRGIKQTKTNNTDGITLVGVPQGALAPQRVPVDECDADYINKEDEWEIVTDEQTESSENSETEFIEEDQSSDLSSIESKKATEYPFEYYYIT